MQTSYEARLYDDKGRIVHATHLAGDHPLAQALRAHPSLAHAARALRHRLRLHQAGDYAGRLQLRDLLTDERATLILRRPPPSRLHRLHAR